MEHLTTLLTTIGYVGFFAIIFFETALPVCFFLPGDTLLLAAGILAAQGTIYFPVLLICGIVAAIGGGYLGFGLGKYLGEKLFADHKRGILNSRHRDRAEKFYNRFGTIAILLARFVPVIRTFISTVAGVGRMPFRKFSIANIVGGILWISIVPSIGYFLGQKFPKILDLIPLIFGLVVALSLMPVGYSLLKIWLQQRCKA